MDTKNDQQQKLNKKEHATPFFLLLSVFFSGMTTLAVEFAASRLLGNVFGTSNIVWASIIGLILIYLTLGYWLGGKLADRFPSEKTFYTILVWAGFMVGLVPLLARPILRISAKAFDQLQMPILFGSFTAVLLLFVAPVTLLGTTSPFALKLALKDTRETGGVAGRFSAVSTLGSFVGTFLTVLVFIPLVGTYRTFVIFSFVMLLIALVGLWLCARWRAMLPYLWMPIVIIMLGILGIQGTDKNTEGLIYETESAYNYIQVLQQEDYRFLRLNEGQGMHSIYHPTVSFYRGPWSQVLVAPYFNPSPHDLNEVKRIAILGLAAGTTARQAAMVYPGVPVDGYEIDPEIIQVGQEYFDMNMPTLNAIAEDGRWGIQNSNYHYDIISVDAYRSPYIPAHMTTVEFFSIVRDHLTEDGVMTINVGRSPFDRDLVNALGTTILQVYPNVYVTDIPDSFNTIIFAPNNEEANWSNFYQNMERLKAVDAHALLIQAMQVTVAGQTEPPARGQIFTDDRAPIEWITNRMVLDFVFSEEAESLQ